MPAVRLIAIENPMAPPINQNGSENAIEPTRLRMMNAENPTCVMRVRRRAAHPVMLLEAVSLQKEGHTAGGV
jgi:hypothetical protein